MECIELDYNRVRYEFYTIYALKRLPRNFSKYGITTQRAFCKACIDSIHEFSCSKCLLWQARFGTDTSPVSIENPNMPNMHITKPEWHELGEQLRQSQIPNYCKYCHDYATDKVPRCNRCRIQVEHDLRTAKHHEVESYCRFCTEWLIERPEEDAYDPCHECQIQYHERKSTSFLSSLSEKLNQECDM